MGFYKIHVVLPLVLLGLPSAVMGFTFPFLQKIIQLDTQYIGRLVGKVGLYIILGNILGSIITGTLLFKYIGTARTFTVIVAISSIFGFCAFLKNKKAPKLLAAIAAILSIGLACFIPWKQQLLGSVPWYTQ